LGADLPDRLSRVLKVLYLIFNEGFHSNRSDVIVREDLCFEAMRLCKMVLSNKACQTSNVYALLGLMCLHASRVKSKISPQGEFMDLKSQDRSLWDQQLFAMGDMFMNKAVKMTKEFSSYHIEAAIAYEHMRAPTFKDTNWEIILRWHLSLIQVQPHPIAYLNTSIVYLQMGNMTKCKEYLEMVPLNEMGQRLNLYYGTWAEYHHDLGEIKIAIEYLTQAIDATLNQVEKSYMEEKKARWEGGVNG